MGAIIVLVVVIGLVVGIIPIFLDPEAKNRKKGAAERWGNKAGKLTSGNWGGKKWGGDDK